MDPLGLVLTVIWFVVLFGGGALVVKSKHPKAKLYLILALGAIPVGYIAFWLFS